MLNYVLEGQLESMAGMEALLILVFVGKNEFFKSIQIVAAICGQSNN